MAVIGLEGCSPLQPRESNIALIGFGGAEGPAPSSCRIDLEGGSDAEHHRLKLLSIPSGEW